MLDRKKIICVDFIEACLYARPDRSVQTTKTWGFLNNAGDKFCALTNCTPRMDSGTFKFI